MLDGKFPPGFFPPAFLAAAVGIWTDRAPEELAAIYSSYRTAGHEPSERAADRWLRAEGFSPFLHDRAIQDRIYPAVRFGDGKTVDRVADGMGGALALVEAKSRLTSDDLKRSCMSGGKFERTLAALTAFYRHGGQVRPVLSRAAVVANRFDVSGRSRFSVAGGRVYFEGAPLTVEGRPVEVVILKF